MMTGFTFSDELSLYCLTMRQRGTAVWFSHKPQCAVKPKHAKNLCVWSSLNTRYTAGETLVLCAILRASSNPERIQKERKNKRICKESTVLHYTDKLAINVDIL